jgi:protein ImuA
VNLSLPFAEWNAPALPADAGAGPPRGKAGVAAATGHEDAALRLGLDLEALHPALWRASQLGGSRGAVSASGYPALDAQLPGGGWPHGVLTELLLPRCGIGELRLLAPALAAPADPPPALPSGVRPAARPGGAGMAADADDGRSVILFDPPAALSAWALLQHGLSPQRWLVVRGRAPRQPREAGDVAPLLPNPDLLWALEHTLRSGHAGAVLAWLPLALRADVLRRLQLAAQACAGPVFVFRDARARSRPSPAPLRLLLQPAGLDGLAVRLLKRRGPPLAEPLRLALPPVLTPRQQAQALVRQAARRSDPVLRDG